MILGEPPLCWAAGIICKATSVRIVVDKQVSTAGTAAEPLITVVSLFHKGTMSHRRQRIYNSIIHILGGPRGVRISGILLGL